MSDVAIASVHSDKTRLIIIIIIIFFGRVFSECTEAIATSLIQLVTNFPEICAFLIDSRFTVWTKMRPLLAH